MEFLECIPGLLIPSSSQYHCISQSYGYYGFWVGRFVDRHYRRWHTTKSAYSCCWDDIFIFGLPHFWDASNRFGIRRNQCPLWLWILFIIIFVLLFILRLAHCAIVLILVEFSIRRWWRFLRLFFPASFFLCNKAM